MLNEFIDHLELQVKNGSIYVIGAQGQLATNKLIDQREKTAKNNARAKKLLAKQLALGFDPKKILAYDCSGLGMHWLQNITKIYSYDMSAHSMYGKCTPITRSQLRRGDWVFRRYTSGENKGKIHHIGYVVDDQLNVIECKGRDDGCVKRPIDASGTGYWNAYGRPHVFADEINNSADGGEIMLKKGDKGDNVKAWQESLLKLEFALPKYGADGDFGSETESATKAFQKDKGLPQTGKVDVETTAAMFKALKDDSGKILELQKKVEALNKKVTDAVKILS